MPVLKIIIGQRSNHRLKTLAKMWIVLSAMLLAVNNMLAAQTLPSREYQVKAIFLFNFAQFVDWPVHVFPEADTPLVIGVLGEDLFGAYLDETVLGEEKNRHPLVIQRYRHVTDVKACHILFINITEMARLEQILTDLKGKSILTVGDASGFTKQGGMVQFFTENNKIRFQINLQAVKEAELTISSKLLRLAEIQNN